MRAGAMRSRGFTIVEIMVGIGIVALVLMVAAPSAGAWLQNTYIRNAAESVLNGVQTARLEAIKRNRPVSFRLTDAASTAWQVCVYDAALDACDADPAATLATKGAKEASANARVGADMAASDPASPLAPGAGVPGMITFDSFGRLMTTPSGNLVRVDVRNVNMDAADERRMVILIAAGGQVRMCDPKLSHATNPQGCA